MSNVLAGRGRDPRAPEHEGPWPLAEPFRIGGLTLANRVVQAPLAGIANWAFRSQSTRHGAGLTVSEMVASFGVHHGNRRTVGMLTRAPAEGPMGFQIFGTDPAVMAEAARRAEEAGADLVDVNMGCPVPKICKTGAGAALLADLDRAAAIVGAMREAVRIPVTVKMRRGLTPATSNPVEIARRMEAAGAAALTVHPRAAADEYGGTADHRITAQVVEAVEIPVIASGDIAGPADALRVIEETGCEAVAVGRAALGNPWVFRALATGRPGAAPPLGEVVAEVRRFAADAQAALGDRAGAYMRKFYPWYLAGRHLPAGEMEALVTAPTLEDALARLDRLAAQDLAA